MRIATYNVEWFTGLFDDEDQLLLDDGWSARHNITRAQQAQALGTVFRAMDADAVIGTLCRAFRSAHPQGGDRLCQ
jgi:hypothetical protein